MYSFIVPQRMEKVHWDKCRDVLRWHVLLPRNKLLLKQTFLRLSCWVTTAMWNLLLVLLGTRIWYEFLGFFFNLTYVFGTPSMCQALL